uniref:Dynein attachment factor N-terminal domain-containing protein n=1 Tax=Lates calcarifer TaxID=8187 RepID=A0A4W6EZ68_LATCA
HERCQERDVIDFSALECELQAAVESERRHRRENDAKLRAVDQKVATYREFRDLVLACRLKPLDKKDKDGAPRKQPWNPVVTRYQELPGVLEKGLSILSCFLCVCTGCLQGFWVHQDIPGVLEDVSRMVSEG